MNILRKPIWEMKKFSISPSDEIFMLLEKWYNFIFFQNMLTNFIFMCYQSLKGELQLQFLFLQNACCLLHLSGSTIHNVLPSLGWTPGSTREPGTLRSNSLSSTLLDLPTKAKPGQQYRTFNKLWQQKTEKTSYWKGLFSFRVLDSGCSVGFKEYTLFFKL